MTGSFISLSHAIKREGALTCNDCHSMTGVMDFNALSYSPEQSAYLQTVLQAVQSFGCEQTVSGLKLSWAAIPGRTYELLGTTNVSAGVWLTVTNLPATSRSMEMVVPQSQITTDPQRYFRVREISP